METEVERCMDGVIYEEGEGRVSCESEEFSDQMRGELDVRVPRGACA